jgi:hypothetical protein
MISNIYFYFPAKPQRNTFLSSSSQRNGALETKEIIDLEETVCLPRYTCDGRSNEVKQTKATATFERIFNLNLAFTDSINENVSFPTINCKNCISMLKLILN